LIGGEIKYSRRGELNGTVCHSMAYEGSVRLRELRFEQFFIPIDQSIYILTMSCKKENYEEFAELSGKIMESFTIKK
ncbi:MAG: hypothetical protein HRT57_12765, partial [Crocinitomicaceae bacterium]|nr:hypothetical protein [Crocinitomicaceae bacterium]